ncbi:MAG: hypothetical protein AAFR46_03820 [Pseudomonadota bacterium]
MPSGPPAARALKQHVSALVPGLAQAQPDTTAMVEAATRTLAAEAALLDRVLPLIGPVPIGDVRRILAQARLCLCEQCETELPDPADPANPADPSEPCPAQETLRELCDRVSRAPNQADAALLAAARAFQTATLALEHALLRVERRV